MLRLTGCLSKEDPDSTEVDERFLGEATGYFGFSCANSPESNKHVFCAFGLLMVATRRKHD